LLNLWTCKPYVKKRLMVKKVTVCDLPTVVCNVEKGKGGKGKGGGYDASMEGPEVPLPDPFEAEEPQEIEGGEGVEFDPNADVPEPPPLSMSRRLRRAVPTPARRRNGNGGLFELLLR
jgi:hypothetical protein